MNNTTATRKVILRIHTTCGIDFEILDAVTEKSITDRMFWASDEDIEDDEELESRGWEHFRKKIAEKGWEILREEWS
jgi:hypothetical protein